MPNFRKGLAHIAFFLIVVGVIIAGVAWFITFSSPQNESNLLSIPITPSQLMPTVTAGEARANICKAKTEELFVKLCEDKFDVVAKEDQVKIADLISILSQVQNDMNFSDYDRLLVGQLVFGALPSKDSPLTFGNNNFSLFASLNNFFPDNTMTIHAQEIENNTGVNFEEFKKIMQNDLQKIVGDLPEGHNAWIINVMVSKHQWINGVRQPIYSDQYSESFDPFPSVSTESKDESKILYNVRSVVGAKSIGQDADGASVNSEMVAYSFSINSWNSPPHGSDSVLTVAESGPDPEYLTSNRDLSEDNYSGENILSELLAKVSMPNREIAIAEAKNESKLLRDKNSSSDSDEFPKYYSLEEWGEIIEAAGTGPLPCPIVHVFDVVICHENQEKLDDEVCKYNIETWGPENEDNYYPQCH